MRTKTSGTGGSAPKKKKPAPKKPAATAKPKATSTAAKRGTMTRAKGNPAGRRKAASTLASAESKAIKEAKKYVPSASSVKSAAKSIPGDARKGLSALFPDWGLPGGGVDTGDMARANKYMDKTAPSIQKAASKVSKRKKSAIKRTNK